MNKDQIKQLAKGFCEAEGIHIPELQNGITPYLTKFLQSLLESGEVVEAEKWVNNSPIDNDVLLSFGFEEIGTSYFHPKMSGLYLHRPYKEAKHFLVKSNGQDKLTALNSVHKLQLLYTAITGEPAPEESPASIPVKELKDMNVPQWIIADVKPEKHKRVTILEWTEGLSEPSVLQGSWEGDRWRIYGGATAEKVTHWQPLPPAPGESPVSIPVKEVKTAEQILLKCLYGDFIKKLPENAHQTTATLKAMEEYADQFKSTPSKEISDEDIELESEILSKQFIKDYRMQIKIGIERGIEMTRDQLKAKQ